MLEYEKWQEYLRILERELTPEEFREVLQAVGKLEEVLAKNAAIEEMMLRQKFREMAKKLGWDILRVGVAIGGILWVLPAVIRFFKLLTEAGL